MSWTDERIALLKKMWKEGKSAAEIAKTLGKGVTRNAVIGKAHRMGLSGRPSPIKKPAPAPKKEGAVAATARKEPSKEVKKPAAAPAGKSASAPARDTEEPRKVEKEIVPPGGGVSLLELTERMCKWPIGDPREADFTFCGRGIRTGTPYCHDHASMAYQTSSRSRSHSHAIVANDKAVAVVAEEAPETPETEEEEEVA